MTIVDKYLRDEITGEEVVVQLGVDLAKIHEVSSEGKRWTLFHAAVSKEDLNLLQDLFAIPEALEKINNCTDGGTTAISLAVTLRKDLSFSSLKEHGAGLYERGEDGHSAVWNAYYCGTEFVKGDLAHILGGPAMQDLLDTEF